jgi:hypothetical protein
MRRFYVARSTVSHDARLAGGAARRGALGEAAQIIETAVEESFASRMLRPMEAGGDQGLRAAAQAVVDVLETKLNGRRV